MQDPRINHIKSVLLGLLTALCWGTANYLVYNA